MNLYLEAMVSFLLLVVISTLSGCSTGVDQPLEPGDGEGNGAESIEAAISKLPFPVHRKKKASRLNDAFGIPDGGDRFSEWLVKLDDTWSVTQIDDFIATAEKAGFSIADSGKQRRLFIFVIRAPLVGLVSLLEKYPTIDFVEEDEETYVIPPHEFAKDEGELLVASQVASQNNVPWGLDRLDERDLALDQSYVSGHGTGTSTHVYILDTGIRTTHSDFQGRAIPTLDMCGPEAGQCGSRVQACDAGDRSCAADGHGHGTHCAGTVGGGVYGVAKDITLHAVKVVDDLGFGPVRASTGAIDWIIENGPKPAVISMSLGWSGRIEAFKIAIDRATESGVTVVVAAGNENTDACFKSPAFVPNAITVGATDSSDRRVSPNLHGWGSNWGECVDIMAPGFEVTSAGIHNDSSPAVMSGTSMACPHVAGVAALLQAEDNGRSPQQIAEQMRALASNDKVSGLIGATANKLLFAGGGQPEATRAPTPVPPATGIVVESFSTESFYDTLRVNGVDYSGNLGPHGVTPDPNSQVVWSSDVSVEQTGWKLCLASDLPPWRVIDGPCEIDDSGCALSPNYPQEYAPNQRCTLSMASATPPTPSPTPTPGSPATPLPTPLDFDGFALFGEGYHVAPEGQFLPHYTDLGEISTADCASRCRADSNCAGFISEMGFWCWLLDPIAKSWEFQPHEGLVLYHLENRDPTFTTTPQNGYCVDASGNEFDQYRKQPYSLVDCQALCSEVPECGAFTYEALWSACVIHTPDVVPTYEGQWGWTDTSKTGIGDAVAGRGNYAPAQCYLKALRPRPPFTTTPQNGYCVDASGNEFDQYRKQPYSLGDCQALCSGVPECGAFTYEAEWSVCVIHTPDVVPTYEGQWGWTDTSKTGIGDAVAGKGDYAPAQCYLKALRPR